MFELPLLNTVILLSSGATITYAHHSLINEKRKGALIGSFATIVLAAVFTLFQIIEYNVSSFTLSDGIFGSCFFFGTGFHGLILHGALLTHICYNNNNNNNFDNDTNNIYSNKDFNKSLKGLNIEFLEWLVGFTDGDGNFNIKIMALKDNDFKSVQFTFKIGLHKDEIEVLEYIMNTLKCGHISKSKDKVNYFINDLKSLINIIIPIFDYVNLNSSKYHHYMVFREAVLMTLNKEHLSRDGKIKIINYQKQMQNMTGKWIPNTINTKIKITKYWLSGFIDAEGCFSTNKYVPRFKIENHIKELELYNKIREFFTCGTICYTMPRSLTSNPTIILEINEIKLLKKAIIPFVLENDKILLKTLKKQDFLYWLNLIDIYYKGYHTLLEGKFIFDSIKSCMNKNRLSTNKSSYLLHTLPSISYLYNKTIEEQLDILFNIESPYQIKDGIRYIRNTNNLVSESLNIVCIHIDYNKRILYNSISECAKDLNISRKIIKNSIHLNKEYKGYIFMINK